MVSKTKLTDIYQNQTVIDPLKEKTMNIFSSRIRLKTTFTAVVIGSSLLAACGNNTTAATTTSIARPSTTLAQPSVNKDGILTAICREAPKQTTKADYGGQGLDTWECQRNGHSVQLVIPNAENVEKWAAHMKKMIEDKVLKEAANLCGPGWTVSSVRDDANSIYQDLREAGIPTESCA